MADNKIIHDLLKEVRDDQKEARTENQEHRETSIKHHADTNARLDIYNEQLKTHIEGVKTLKEMHKSNVERIEVLEEPAKALSTIKKWAVWTAGIAGAIVAVAKVIGLF